MKVDLHRISLVITREKSIIILFILYRIIKSFRSLKVYEFTIWRYPFPASFPTVKHQKSAIIAHFHTFCYPFLILSIS